MVVSILTINISKHDSWIMVFLIKIIKNEVTVTLSPLSPSPPSLKEGEKYSFLSIDPGRHRGHLRPIHVIFIFLSLKDD